jgi:hypothetical protein
MLIGRFRAVSASRLPAVCGTFLSLLIACLGAEAPVHAHASMIAGWHEAAPHGCKHQEAQASCSICRAVHETSLATPTPYDLVRPDLVVTAHVPKCDARRGGRNRRARRRPRDASGSNR